MKPYNIIQPTAKRVPVLLSVPHCGTEFPDELKEDYFPEMKGNKSKRIALLGLRPLVGRALIGRALMGRAAPLWAGPLWAGPLCFDTHAHQ